MLGGSVAQLNYRLDPDGHLFLGMPSALSTRRLSLDTVDYNNPVRAVSTSAMLLARGMGDFLQNLGRADGNPDLPEQLMSSLINGWKAIAYAATELFEAYNLNLKGALRLNDKSSRKITKNFDEVVKSHRDHWSFLANKMKHNGNEPIAVSHQYVPSGRVVHGYSLIRPVGMEAKEVNKQFHKGQERARSFDAELRQLIFDILRVDRAAELLVRSLPDDPDIESLPDFPLTWSIGEQLRTIAQRPLRTVPLQSRMIDGFKIEDGRLVTVRESAEMIFEDSHARSMFTADGITRIIPII